MSLNPKFKHVIIYIQQFRSFLSCHWMDWTKLNIINTHTRAGDLSHWYSSWTIFRMVNKGNARYFRISFSREIFDVHKCKWHQKFIQMEQSFNFKGGISMFLFQQNLCCQMLLITYLDLKKKKWTKRTSVTIVSLFDPKKLHI